MGHTSTITKITGTSGNDDITVPAGRLGTVQIDGGAGNDTLDLNTYGSSGVGVLLTNARHTSSTVNPDHAFYGVPYDYSLAGASSVKGTITNVENIIGTSGNDYLVVDSTYPSLIDGGTGNDFLESVEGSGTLVGGPGSDWLLAYHSNNTLVGGTYDYSTGVATGDGTPDYFFANGGAKILDFEVGTDHLIFETGAPDGAWQPYGANGSEYVANGSVVAILANVTPDAAANIHLQSVISATNGQIYGTSGDDLLYSGSNTTIYFGANSGNDYVTHFDKLTDTLVFPENTSIAWHDSMVNGEAVLLGVFNGGSVALSGLQTSDLASLSMVGVTSSSTDVHMLGAWSVPSDTLV